MPNDDFIDLTDAEKRIIHWALGRAEVEWGFELSDEGEAALESAKRAVPFPDSDRYYNGLVSDNP